MAQKTLQAEGGCLAYLDPHPEGKTVALLLHGLGSTGDSWQLQFPALRMAGCRPIAPDVPGFGESRFANGSWSIAKAAAGMVALLDELGVEKAHVVGISMGGVLALQLALSHTDRVEKLVLVSTFARLRPKRLVNWYYFLKRFFLTITMDPEAQAHYVAQRIFPGADQEIYRQTLVKEILQADRGTYRQAMMALGRFDVESRLREIHAPTLVITGERDTTVPPQNQRVLVEKIPGARQVVFPDAGHGVIVDQPDLFNQALVKFLATREF